MHKTTHWAAAALLSVACAGAAFAQGKDKSTTMGGGAAKAGAFCPSNDEAKLRTVLSYLHSANESEIKHGKLALERAQSPEVKEFADRMVKDHTDADKKLTDLAKKKNIDLTMATPMDPIHAAMTGSGPKLDQALQGKSGAAFESAYIGPEAYEHILVLAVIDEGMKVVKDDEVKKLLGDLQTTLTTHRDHALKVSDKMRLMAPQKGIGGGPPAKTEQEPFK